MKKNRMMIDDLPSHKQGTQDQEECPDGRWEFYRKALISFLVLIVVGAAVGTAVSLLIH